LQYLYYSLLFAFLYFYLGVGLSLLFCPKALGKYILFFSPLVGYCYLSLTGWYCYNLDIGGTDVYAPALFVPPFFFLCYALLSCRGRLRSEELISAQMIAPVVVGIVVFLIVSMPSILSRNGANSTSPSPGNNDITNYANIARFLKDFTRSETGGYLGQIDFKFLADKTVFGAFLATAAPSSLFSLDTYQLQDISLRVFFLFSVLLCYVLAKEAFGYGHYPAVGLAVLYGLNSVMYYTLYQGFEAQIIATGLTLFFILIQIHAINNSEKRSDYFPYIFFGVLLNWGISISYPHMLPFVYVPVVGYVVLVSFHARSWKASINWGAFALATIALTFILSPSRGQSLVRYLLVMNKVEAGWHIHWLFPDAFFGFTFKHWNFQPHSDWIRLAITIPVLTLIVTGLVVAYKKDRRLFILAVVSVLPILTGYFLLARPDAAKAEWGGYKSYKLLSFFLPLVMLGSLILFRNLRFNSESRIAFVLPGLLLLLVGCNLLSAAATVKAMMISQRVVREDIAALKEIESNSLVDSINITTADNWDNMWYAHFLMRKKLYYKNSVYYPASSLIGHWTLKEGIEDLDILHVDGFETPDAAGHAAGASTFGTKTIPVNSSFVLERLGAASNILQAKTDAGWHASEGTLIWTGGESSVSTIILTSADRLVINFRLKYWPLNPNNRLSIYLNGAKVTDCPNSNHCEADEITLAKGQNVLELRAMLQPEVPGNGDPRRLGFAVQSIDISPSISATTAPKAAAAGK
jgi:hypothetical protein